MNLAPLLDYLEKNPRDRATLARLADQALETQNEARALPLVVQGAELAGSDARLWQWTGLLYRALDDRERAMSAFAKAAMLEPQDASIAHGRARTTLEAGLPAVALFDAARQLAPLDSSILLGLAAARLAEGDAAAAEVGLDRLLQDSPGWLPGHADIVQLRWMMGDQSGFAASYERALVSAPRDPALWQAFIMALIQADQTDRALCAIAEARLKIGDAQFLDANEAAVRSQLGQVNAADACFARLAGVREVTLAVHSVRHALRTGRIDLAVSGIEPWLETPEQGLLWPYASVAWRLAGDPRSAWLDGHERLIGVVDLAERLPSLKRLADVLRGLHQARHQHLDQSVRGGTQTDGTLLFRLEPEIRHLRSVIMEAVSDHIAGLPEVDPSHPTLRARRDKSPRLAGSWSVRLKGSGFHANHFHPAGWLSSALYVALPEQDRAADDAGSLTLGQPPAELGLPTSPVRTIEPRPGRLVLFPSTMWHGTVPFTRGERLTVAFDVQMPQ